MANNLESYGLEFIAEDEDTLSGFVGYTVSNGKAICGYYGTPYLYMPMGDAEFWASTAKNPDGNLYVDKFHTHCGGRIIWDMVCSGMDITPKDSLTTERFLMLNRAEDNAGLLPVDIINADVLPGFLRGDRIRLQVVAQCLDINYYASQEEYDESMHSDEDGKKWGIANGSLAPLSFLVNHNPDNYIEGHDYEDDCFIHFTATVKALYHGTFELGEEKDNTFIRCVADTQFGEIEFHHSIAQVQEDMRKNIRIGSVISGVCMISGDAAINEYEDGIVRDFDHNLRLLRYTLAKGEAERLRSILAEDCVYETDNYDSSHHGPDDIIARLQYVADNHEGEYIAHLAEISSIDADEMEYPVGTKCIVLADNEEDNYESIVFMTVDENANITHIKVSTDGRYHFNVQQPERPKSILDDIELPKSVAEAIIARARFHGLLDSDIDAEQIMRYDDRSVHKNNAKEMLSALRADPQPDAVSAVKNIMGYLLAKSVEQTFNEHRYNPEHKTRLLASYSASDAFNSEISSTLEGEDHEMLVRTLDIGKQFGADIFSFMELSDKADEDFEEIFIQAAIVVQRIGQHYSIEYFNLNGGN